ncbi:MAG TPA: aldehyde dehydrogenase family protein [Chitinophagaceae bacterium]|jgi:acyl-CoA reductase-like NAD-dependent aldehyde dehydrogenase/GMP synthase-like glutamine amidotransferase|nr:aldehyde dehydrogenase family protein [Chitinophagaceae bacterium]
MKKKIGISFTKTSFQNYWNWFTPDDLQDDIELIELNFEKNNTEDIYKCDAFVLTGGVDVHPSFYNGQAVYNNSPASLQPERDVFEEKIYRYSQLNKLPVLGICRGMQLINVLEGGKLIQDLDNGNARHKKEESDKEHTVVTENKTFLHQIADSVSGHVNSAHHQAIDPNAIGDNLIVNAYDDDDEKIIEGLEFKNKTDKAFMLCVQWHPERMKDKEKNPFSQNLKKQFLTAIRETLMKKLTIINPATEEIITELNEDTQQSLQKKFELLNSAKPGWHDLALGERVEILKKFSELLEKNIEQLASVLTSEVGKPLQQSRNEVNGARARIKWLCENAEKYLSDEVMSNVNGMEEKISYEPLGVVCNISAWNYPYLVGVNVFVPALLAGNAVMYKPSEYSTLTGLQIEKLLKQAGVPENIFHVAIGGGNVGELLLELPFDGYFFTGSYKTGKYIYEKVASKMIPCQCELGGKDPLYVADDIKDIKTVAAATADGAFYNNGQSCCAVERIYVNEKVYDQYIDEFIKEVKSWKIGSPVEQGIYIGPLSRKEQLAVLEKQVSDAVNKGAMILTGGKKINAKGYFFEPTVLVNVNHHMSVMKDESFGPVIGIMKVKNEDEAIKLMKDTEYGLTASVYSSDKKKAENILKQINAGTGYWNCCDRVSAALPWSGRKHSGIGSTLSHAGLRAFVKPKGYHLRG